MHKFVAVTLVALSLTACGSKDETLPESVTPAPACPPGFVYREDLKDLVPEGTPGDALDAARQRVTCVPVEVPAVPAVDAGVVPGEGVSLSADPATAQKAE